MPTSLRIYRPISTLKSLQNSERIFELGNQGVRILMGIMIFLKPFDLITSVEEICFYLSVFLVSVLSFFSKRKIFSFDSPLTLPFLFFVSWAFVGLFFALNRENSINDFYAHLLKYLAIYYILINFFNSKKLLVHLSWIIIISAALFSWGAMTYFYLILGNKPSTLLRIPISYIYVYNHFLYVFAFLLSIQLLTGETKIFHRILLLICLSGTAMATLLSQIRSALAAMVIGLFIQTFKNKKVLLLLIIFVSASFTLISLLGNRLTPSVIWEHKNIRIGTTYLFLEMIRDYPLTGIGFGMQTYDDPKLLAMYNRKVPAPYRQDPPIASPHNIFTDVTVRLGLVGLGFFVYIIFIFIRMGWKMIRYGGDDFIRKWAFCLINAFAAFFVNALAMDAIFGIQAIVFYTLLAMMTILCRLNTPSKNSAFSESKRAS